MSGLFAYNGSAVVAMKGKGCVAIGCDTRLGVNQFQTVSCDFPKIFPLTNRCYVGLAGLATDLQTSYNYLRFRMNLNELEEERQMKPEVVSSLISSILYARRFAPWFVEPIVVGLTDKNDPYISAFDFIGAKCEAEDFLCTGSAQEQIAGACEMFWKPNLEPEDLFETVSQCLMAGVDRDCVSGWGCVVHVLTPKKIITRRLKTRMD